MPTVQEYTSLSNLEGDVPRTFNKDLKGVIGIYDCEVRCLSIARGGDFQLFARLKCEILSPRLNPHGK